MTLTLSMKWFLSKKYLSHEKSKLHSTSVYDQTNNKDIGTCNLALLSLIYMKHFYTEQTENQKFL